MKHFTIEELTRSETARSRGINNTPSAEHEAHLVEMVNNLIDALREQWAVYCANEQIGTPQLRVSSGYRSPALNAAVGGSNTSAHSIGYALDLVPMNGRLKEFKKFCREFLTSRAFDQMISEDENASGVPKWIHIGYKNAAGQQRRQFLSMVGGKYISQTA